MSIKCIIIRLIKNGAFDAKKASFPISEQVNRKDVMNGKSQ